MGKIICYLNIIVISFSLACSEKYDTFFDGTANVYLQEGDQLDTLLDCSCGIENKKIAVSIYNFGFEGIQLIIFQSRADFSIEMMYFSDTYKFDGKLYKPIPIEKEHLQITYEPEGKNLKISGAVQVESKPNEINERIFASGSFKCIIKDIY